MQKHQMKNSYLPADVAGGIIEALDNQDDFRAFIETLWFTRRKYVELLERTPKEQRGTYEYQTVKMMFDSLNSFISGTLVSSNPLFAHPHDWKHFDHKVAKATGTAGIEQEMHVSYL